MKEPTLMEVVNDLSSIKGEYIRLMALTIADGLDEVLLILKGESKKPLDQVILKMAEKCYEVSLADFSENANLEHGKEF